MLFLSLKDAQEAQFEKDSDAIVRQRARTASSPVLNPPGNPAVAEAVNAAQANSFEALPFYIGAVIIAHQLGAFQTRLDLLAFLYIVLRLMYILFYLADMATPRSLVWTAALAVNVAILFV